jgi:hypothetical protein
MHKLFWRYVNKNGPLSALRPDLGPCWLWTGHIDKRLGYGKYSEYSPERYQNGDASHSIAHKAHRYAWEQINGNAPEGLEPDHLCRVRICVNPTHLELVTHRENILRSQNFIALHAKKTHCPQGHNYTHTYRGRRVCAICKRMQALAAYYAKKKLKGG